MKGLRSGSSNWIGGDENRRWVCDCFELMRALDKEMESRGRCCWVMFNLLRKTTPIIICCFCSRCGFVRSEDLVIDSIQDFIK